MISEQDCILRRVIALNGRSCSFINGVACPLQLMRELGDLLVNIHGQHQHQALMKKDYQRELLDYFASHTSLCQQVNTLYQDWRQTKNHLEKILAAKEQQSRIELLRYQVQELQELNLMTGEITALENEHKKLANAEYLISSCNNALQILSEHDQQAVLTLLHDVTKELIAGKNLDKQIANAAEMINQAIIQVEEARDELSSYLDATEINSERLQWLENRLDLIHQIARKHHIATNELNSVFEKLQAELQQLENIDESAQLLQQKIAQLEKDYEKLARQLTASRQQAAQKLNALVTEKMQTLGMAGGEFAIQLQKNSNAEPNAHGAEKIEFMVSANRGQPLQPLSKVASGGELSRIGLAIQVITAQNDNTPTLIFDEVDVGIGGGIAEIVGKLLRKLGDKAQVLCVTHLPQVAAQGHHHLQVKKTTVNEATFTQLESLKAEKRVDEIARMLGGIKITEQTLAHAKEMLELH